MLLNSNFLNRHVRLRVRRSLGVRRSSDPFFASSWWCYLLQNWNFWGFAAAEVMRDADTPLGASVGVGNEVKRSGWRSSGDGDYLAEAGGVASLKKVGESLGLGHISRAYVADYENRHSKTRGGLLSKLRRTKNPGSVLNTPKSSRVLRMQVAATGRVLLAVSSFRSMTRMRCDSKRVIAVY